MKAQSGRTEGGVGTLEYWDPHGPVFPYGTEEPPGRPRAFDGLGGISCPWAALTALLPSSCCVLELGPGLGLKPMQ